MTGVSVTSFPSITSLFKAILSLLLKPFSWSCICLCTLCTLEKDFENDSQGRVGTDLFSFVHECWVYTDPLPDDDYTMCQHVAVGGHCCLFWWSELIVKTILDSFCDTVISIASWNKLARSKKAFCSLAGNLLGSVKLLKSFSALFYLERHSPGSLRQSFNINSSVGRWSRDNLISCSNRTWPRLFPSTPRLKPGLVWNPYEILCLHFKMCT